MHLKDIYDAVGKKSVSGSILIQMYKMYANLF